MGKILSIVIVAMALGFSSSTSAASPDEENLLGCGCEHSQLQSYLPFTRAIGVSGMVIRSLPEATASAGIPPGAIIEMLHAFSAVIDLDKDIRNGDRFYIRYEQLFTIQGTPIEVGRVQWAELWLATRGTVGLHRFKPARDSSSTFWLADGQATNQAKLRMPLSAVNVTSEFGMRTDPVDQPSQMPMPVMRVGNPTFGRGKLQTHLTGATSVNAPTARGLALGLFQKGPGKSAVFGIRTMHAGVDFAAAPGTPVHAAGDGMVVGARSNGRYGNWIEVEHGDRLATVYGHLSSFAPGIAPGASVKLGDFLGFSGNSGRTTGPHLHFEIHVDGHPTNPIGHPALMRPTLSGDDLKRFRELVIMHLQERDNETNPICAFAPEQAGAW